MGASHLFFLASLFVTFSKFARMLTLRLTRSGKKKAPFYHLVVAEKSRAVQKQYVARLGHYNPLSESGKGELVFDAEKVETYVKNGAQMSQTVARLLAKEGVKVAEKFIEKRASKPQKPKEEPVAEVAEAPEAEAATEEVPAEEAAAEAESPKTEEEPAA